MAERARAIDLTHDPIKESAALNALRAFFEIEPLNDSAAVARHGYLKLAIKESVAAKDLAVFLAIAPTKESVAERARAIDLTHEPIKESAALNALRAFFEIEPLNDSAAVARHGYLKLAIKESVAAKDLDVFLAIAPTKESVAATGPASDLTHKPPKESAALDALRAFLDIDTQN